MVMHERLNGKFKWAGGDSVPRAPGFLWQFDARDIHPDCRIVPSAIMDRHHTLLLKEWEPGAWRADTLAHPAHPSYPEPDSWYPLLSVGDHIPIERPSGLPVGIGVVSSIEYIVVTVAQTPVEIEGKVLYIDPENRFAPELQKVWDTWLLQKMWGNGMKVQDKLVIWEALQMMVEGHPLTISGQFGENSPMTRYSVSFQQGVDINGLADRCTWMMQQLERCAALHDKLPHGSGINDTWAFTVMYGSNAVRCANTFSPMSSAGFYHTDMRFHFLVNEKDKPIVNRYKHIVICANRHDVRDEVEERVVESLR